LAPELSFYRKYSISFKFQRCFLRCGMGNHTLGCQEQPMEKGEDMTKKQRVKMESQDRYEEQFPQLALAESMVTGTYQLKSGEWCVLVGPSLGPGNHVRLFVPGEGIVGEMTIGKRWMITPLPTDSQIAQDAILASRSMDDRRALEERGREEDRLAAQAESAAWAALVAANYQADLAQEQEEFAVLNVGDLIRVSAGRYDIFMLARVVRKTEHKGLWIIRIEKFSRGQGTWRKPVKLAASTKELAPAWEPVTADIAAQFMSGKAWSESFAGAIAA
jgi:hypothetical protein